MNNEEIEAMARVERQHWWYEGLRGAITSALRHHRLLQPVSPRVLDAGCGTGENLRLFDSLFASANLAGFDLSAQAVEVARGKVPGADLYVSDICSPELRNEQYDLVACIDVVCIPGLAPSFNGMKKLVDHLAPGGLFLLNLPAYEWLRSEHDLAIHTSERVTAAKVAELFSALGLRTEHLTYRVCFLFPAMVVSRFFRRLRLQGAAPARSDLQRPPGRTLNAILSRIVGLENRLLARGCRLPFGGSVFAVGRKAGN